MAGEQEGNVEQQQQLPNVDPAIEAEARRGGWRPKEEWRGDANIWVDASTFVKRGREMAPHLARQAGELRRENGQLREQLTTTQSEIQALREQVQGLTTFRQEMSQRETRSERERLLADYKAARTAGNVDLEAQILDKLTNLPTAQPSRAAGPSGSGGGATPTGGNPSGQQPTRTPTQLPPELTNWVNQNDWYQNDPVLQHAMTTVGAEMRASGQITSQMSLTEQLNATARVVLQRYAPPPAHGGPRMEGGGSSNNGGPSGGGGGNNNPQDFDALPQHIKQACDAQGQRLGLIGDKKAFKDQAAWRAYYAKTYFESPNGYDFRPPGN